MKLKFDATRALQTIEDLREQAGDLPDFLERVARFLAGRFEQLGWDVEHTDVFSAHWHWTTFWRKPVGKESPMIIARPRAVSEAPVRVILIAPFCMGSRSLWRTDQAGRPETRDLAGLALLLELARTWPKDRAQRMEVIVAAASGQTVYLPGSQELLRRVQEEWEPRPTLFLVVYGPGLGRELVVDAFPDRQFVKAAAEGLWVPVRLLSMNPFAAERIRWPLKALFPEQVIMAGAESFHAPESALDPAALGRAEQLTSEIALRWARLQTEQSAQAQAEARTASRSSQNPG